MTAKKKDGLTVKQNDAIHDGEGGYLKKGDTFEPVDAEAAKQLKDRGLAE